MAYYKLVGSSNPNTDWTQEVILERDEETGEVTKSVRSGVPVELSAADRDKVQELGYELEESSKSEAEEAEATAQVAGDDVAGAAPSLGTLSDSSTDQGGNARNRK